ncbi:MAG: long-chain-fatty-acid--CoA ligase [Gammaproteobacteria bacterium]|nr:long-chain-fatty-acid--CoA ligase [Gammaproteobacteria bacterium]
MDKVWLSHYQSGIPHHIEPLKYANLVDMLNNSCKKHSEKTAFIHMNFELSFQKFEYLVHQFAAFLQHLGLKKGDRVAIMLPNTLQYPIALFGILKAGLIVVNTNPLYTPPEVAHQLNDAGAKAIIVLENFAHTLEQALPNLPHLNHIILTNVGDTFPWVKKHLINGIIRYVKKMIPEYSLPQAISWQDSIDHNYRFVDVEIAPNDLAFIQYTGGTTGISKGAMLSHHNMVANVMQASTWISPKDFGSDDLVVTALPLYHVFSLTANCLTFLQLGARNMLITNPHDLNFFIKQIKNCGFTAFTGVNTLFNILLRHPKFSSVDFSKLKFTLSGGMALQSSVADKWLEVTNSPILEAYGLTETSPAICINPMSVREFNGSVGYPLPSTEISLRDDQGREVPFGEAGEICVRGPQVMKGYWQHPQETQAIFYEDGFLKTGDIAKFGKDDMVFLVDRKKDMILVSGFNVYPNEVEKVIGMLPGVLEVGVIGVTVDGTSEKVKACIVKADPKLTEQDVRQHCKQYLTAYKVPKIVEFYDQLPKSNVGKILRRELR